MATLKTKITTDRGAGSISVETCNYVLFEAKLEETPVDTAPQFAELTYVWRFPGNNETVVRYGARVLHAWPEKSNTQHDVELTVHIKYTDYEATSQTPKKATATDTLTVSVTGQSYSEKLAGDSVGSLENSAIKEAKSRNGDYVEALEKFKNWKRAVANERGISLVRVEERIRLWREIFNAIRNAGSKTGPPFADELWQKVGVTNDSFKKGYEANTNTWYTNDTESADWRRRMGFKGPNLKEWMIPEVSMEEKNETDKYVKEDASEFLTFGRELLARQSDIERAATDLILWIKFGPGSDAVYASAVPSGSNPPDNAEVMEDIEKAFQSIRESRTRTGGTRSSGDPSSVQSFRRSLATGPTPVPGNTFLAQLGAKKYEEQLTILSKVLNRLHESSIGLNFLSQMFGYRNNPGVINAMNIFSPHEFNKMDDKISRRGQNYIATADDQMGTSRSDVYDAGHLKYDSSNGKYSDTAAVVAQAGENLVAALLPGALRYLSQDPDDTTRRDVTAQFGMLVRSAYHSYYGFKNLNQEERNFVMGSFQPRAGLGGSSNWWGWGDTIDLLKDVANSPSKDDDVSSLLLGGGQRPEYIPRIRAMVTAFESSIAKQAIENDNPKLTYEDQVELTIISGAGVAGALASHREFTGFWKENLGPANYARISNLEKIVGTQLAEEIGSETMEEFFEKVHTKVTPWLECVNVIVEGAQTGFAVSRGDYDYAFGLALNTTGGAMMAAGVAASAAEGGAAFWSAIGASSIPGGALAAVGLVFVAIGVGVSYYEKDTPVGKWIMQTSYGTSWGSGQYSDFHALEYGFERNGDPDYKEQHRGYYELASDFSFDGAELNTIGQQNGDEFALKLQLSAASDENSVEKGGAIYLRAHVHLENSTVALPWLHKIGLGDWMHSSTQPGDEVRVPIFPYHIKRIDSYPPDNQDELKYFRNKHGSWLNSTGLSELPEVYRWTLDGDDGTMQAPQHFLTWNQPDTGRTSVALKDKQLTVREAVFNGDHLQKLRLVIHSTFPPILTGIVPIEHHGTRENRRWQWPTTTMEAIYLPSLIVRQLEGRNVRQRPADVNTEFAPTGVQTGLRAFAPLRGPSDGGAQGSKENPTVGYSILNPAWRRGDP